jgi:hypothetical protein
MVKNSIVRECRFPALKMKEPESLALGLRSETAAGQDGDGLFIGQLVGVLDT